jgi:HPt (histidine-containing phosphotransfer) domain-containing protein
MEPKISPFEFGAPPIDFRRLDLFAETERKKSSLLAFFFETTEEILAEMKNALGSGDQTQWKEAAHKLRGAAGNIGTSPLEKLCLESERTASDQDACSMLMKKIEDEIARIKAFIAREAPSVLPRRV